MPPYSPDINIIELVWAELKRFLRKKVLKTKQAIADRVKLFFDEILTVEKCQMYIARVKEVFKNKNKFKKFTKEKKIFFLNFH